MISYSNGKFIPTEKVAIPIANDYLGFKCGYRIFTSSTTIKHKFFRIDDHIDRLVTSAKDINMDLSFSSNELSILIKETISKNNNIKDDFIIFIFLSGGSPEPLTLKPNGPAHLYIIVNPLVLPPTEWYENGIALATFTFQRQFPTAKLLNYVGAINAHQTVIPDHEAQEGLFISPDDNDTILEGTTFSFFIVNQNDTIITRPEDEYILGSITRRVIVDIVKENELDFREDMVKVSNLNKIKEAFLVSSIRGVVPITRVNNIKIGCGKPGNKTLLLMNLYKEIKEKYEYCS